MYGRRTIVRHNYITPHDDMYMDARKCQIDNNSRPLSDDMESKEMKKFHDRLDGDHNPDNTKKAYLKSAKMFEDWYKDEGIKFDDLTQDHTYEYRAKLGRDVIIKRQTRIEGFREASSVNRETSAVNRYLEVNGKRDCNIRLLKVDEPLIPELPTEEEFLAMVAAARTDSDPILSIRDALILSLTGDNGRRSGEIRKLKKNDVNLTTCEITLRNVKGGGNHTLGISDAIVELFKEYFAVRPKGINEKTKDGWINHDDYALLTENRRRLDAGVVYRVHKKYAAKAGMKKPIWPHLLRHFYITKLKTANAQDRVVQKIGCWKSRDMISRYDHALSGEVAETVRRVSAFNQKPDDKVLPAAHDDVPEDKGTSIQGTEDARLKLTMLLVAGKVDQETYKVAMYTLSGGILEELR